MGLLIILLVIVLICAFVGYLIGNPGLAIGIGLVVALIYFLLQGRV